MVLISKESAGLRRVAARGRGLQRPPWWTRTPVRVRVRVSVSVSVCVRVSVSISVRVTAAARLC